MHTLLKRSSSGKASRVECNLRGLMVHLNRTQNKYFGTPQLMQKVYYFIQVPPCIAVFNQRVTYSDVESMCVKLSLGIKSKLKPPSDLMPYCKENDIILIFLKLICNVSTKSLRCPNKVPFVRVQVAVQSRSGSQRILDRFFQNFQSY